MKEYTRVIRAKHSPRNKCHAFEGELLIVEPLLSVPTRSLVKHWFVSVDGERKSKYAWVALSEPFTLEEFAQKHVPRSMDSPLFLGALEALFDSIGRVEPEKPVACDYVLRSGDRIENQKMVLDIHRVVFYPG